jgi:DNA polymerase III sliding clamp (beta) subunit (PCNA family)
MANKNLDCADLDVSFNGKQLLQVLKTFDTENIEFHYKGINQPNLLTNGVNDIILMPLMFNN